MTQQKSDAARLNAAIELIDSVNNDDPNIEISGGKKWPKESLYAHRMTDMLQRYAADAEDAMIISIRAQHIQRWKSPRSDFPMNRKGYHLWRTALYTFHAEAVAALLVKAGYENEFIERVKFAVSKKKLKTNADTQLLEDVSALVFIEYYMLAFAEKHPEYDEDKWLDIIRKTWRKMSENAQQFALTGNIKLPEALVPLIQKAVSD